MITEEIIEEEQKIDAVVGVIPENYLVDNVSKSKILFKSNNSYGHIFTSVICNYKFSDDEEIDNTRLFERLKENYGDSYDNIQDFMNGLNRIKSEYVIVTKTGPYGNTQVRNYVKKTTPSYQWTKAYNYGFFVHIPTLWNIWNNFKVDYASIDKAKKQEQKERIDFFGLKETVRQVEIRNRKIEEYKNDLEFFLSDIDSLKAEILNQTLRVVKTVAREPSETEDRFHRVLRIIEKLHPKSQSNIKSSTWTTSGESYELRQWKKPFTVTREQFSNFYNYCSQYEIDEDIPSFRDLTISLLDLDEANHDILNLVSAVAKMIEDIVLN